MITQTNTFCDTKIIKKTDWSKFIIRNFYFLPFAFAHIVGVWVRIRPAISKTMDMLVCVKKNADLCK